ncbi:Na+/H+ antiporter NhaC [Brachybacterium vulturis]|uniref:Na+/H+ antiporter NhaC n=1 Tax=Brachybacterium vulturis TaxID=2017484 RepID=A0A291GK20_9MICO|nr:Na+/H+ antiporter NhaC [Brachybacterium vulturis]ATG50396.1 Na+/H+ antiporter NhaC [Brachybacterium vulturis]
MNDTHDASEGGAGAAELQQSATGTHRRPTLLIALIPIVGMAVFLGVGYLAFGLNAEPMIILSAIVAGIVARSLGWSWDEMIDSVADKMRKTWPAILILVCVGLLIGAWMAGGTIPMMIYWGLKLISPKFIGLTALFVTSIVALATGTSWGAVGTIGVAFMGVAIGMDASLPLVAGAVVAGAYFGDKMSPLSDTTNLASMITQVNLYEHIANLLWTTLPAYVASAVVFLFVGLSTSGAGGVSSSTVEGMLVALDSGFEFNLVILLPVLVILAGSLLRLPTIPVMLTASAVAMINALAFQGIALQDVFDAIVNGFDLEMITRGRFDAAAGGEDLATLLNRGGMNSMMGTLLIAFCAIAFAGIVDVTGSLQVLVERLLSGVRNTFGLVAATVVTCLTTIGVTCNGQISIILPGEIFHPEYVKRGVHPKVLGRTIEDSASVIEPLLPWTAAGAYMAATLGVPTIEYLPWAVQNWAAVLVALVLAATGLGITRLRGRDAGKEERSELPTTT